MARVIKTDLRFFCIFLCLITSMLLFMFRSLLESPTKFAFKINTHDKLLSPDQFFYKIVEKSAIVQRLQQIARKVKVNEADCSAVAAGPSNHTTAGKNNGTSTSAPLSNSFYLEMTTDCADFQKRRGYIMDSLTYEEEQFPLAYSMVVYKDTEMVERLLRAIYRPQNVYCIHVDQKADMDTFEAISAIANCFTNVFLASRRTAVFWANYGVLESELICMQELWRYRKWKYFINLTGQEFPLKTNYELVKILTAYDGAIDVMTSVKTSFPIRWRNSTPPHGLRAVQGSVHIVVHRGFVDYVLHNDTAQELLNWTRGVDVPDVTYFAMLNANPQLGIKGTYLGEPEMSDTRPFVARYKNWEIYNVPCAGRFVRHICILTTGDLPRLVNATEMFANKFFINEDRVVIGCLEEKIFNDTRDEYIGSKIFDTTYYENLDFVINKVE